MRWTTAITRRWRLWSAAAVVPLMALAITGGVLAPAAASAAHAAGAGIVRTTGAKAGNPFCKYLGKRYQASAGANMFCFGPKTHVTSNAIKASIAQRLGGPANVNAASFAEDVSPSGVQSDGQSETSIAASGPYVVESWNDSTGFFSSCPSAMSKEELTGFGFSSNGGKSGSRRTAGRRSPIWAG